MKPVLRVDQVAEIDPSSDKAMEEENLLKILMAEKRRMEHETNEEIIQKKQKNQSEIINNQKNETNIIKQQKNEYERSKQHKNEKKYIEPQEKGVQTNDSLFLSGGGEREQQREKVALKEVVEELKGREESEEVGVDEHFAAFDIKKELTRLKVDMSLGQLLSNSPAVRRDLSKHINQRAPRKAKGSLDEVA